MLLVFFTFLLAVAAAQNEEPCNCGRRNTARIIGGEETGINEFPMMAAIVNSGNGKLICGATIISNTYAVTAAHCLDDEESFKVKLLIGEHDHSKDTETNSTETIAIDRIILHPNYNQKGEFDNDIALVHLADLISFNRNVGPACLPFTQKGNYFIDENVYALGWGKTKIDGELDNWYSDVLKKTELKVLDNSKCETYASKMDILCTFKTGTGLCKHDAGGPVLWQDPATLKLQLVGVHSSSALCGEYNNIQTRVTSYLDWIETTAADANFCKM